MTDDRHTGGAAPQSTRKLPAHPADAVRTLRWHPRWRMSRISRSVCLASMAVLAIGEIFLMATFSRDSLWRAAHTMPYAPLPRAPMYV